MHLQSISNGLGAPSIYLLLLAIRRQIPATVSITADTGWELDKLWNTGRRSTAEEYFNEIVVPLCKGTHVTPRFVRAVDENKAELMPLGDQVVMSATGRVSGVPMFGSRGGRDIQTCTDKMKIRACRQEARRWGAKTNCNAQGIHFSEAARRVKGIYLRQDGPWSIYQTTILANKRDKAGNFLVDIESRKRIKYHKQIKWQTHYYPLVDLKLTRSAVYAEMDREGIPYLISSECDLCPHKDLARWERSSPQVIDEGTRIEGLFGGEKFFTDKRIPLKQAIVAMQKERSDKIARGEFVTADTDMDFGCKNDICGV